MCGGKQHNSVHQVVSPTVAVSEACKIKADWWEVAIQSAKHVPLPTGPGHYMGCFQDHPNRDIPDLTLFRSNGMTPSLCARMCAGFSYYALQSYGECRCGGADWLPRYGKRPDGECNTACRGDPNTMCGGAWRNSVFRQPSLAELRKHEGHRHTVSSTAPVGQVTEASRHPREHEAHSETSSTCKKGWKLQGSPPECREVAHNGNQVGFISGGHMMLAVLLGVVLVLAALCVVAFCISFLCNIRLSWTKGSPRGKSFANDSTGGFEYVPVNRPERVCDY